MAMMMTLNEREKKLAWGVGVAFGLFLLVMGVMFLFVSPLEAANAEIKAANKNLAQEGQDIDHAKKDNADWDKLEIYTDQSLVAQRVQKAVVDLASRYHVIVPTPAVPGGANVRPVMAGPKNNVKTDYSSVQLKANVTGGMGGFARFLYDMETSGLPLRVSEVAIRSKTPGTDNLDIDVTIDALVYTPKTVVKSATTGRATTNRAATRGASRTVETPPDADVLKRMMENRNKELQSTATPATTPAPASAPAATGPAKTEAELEAEMIARRRGETAAVSTGNPSTAPATKPAGGAQ